MCPERNGYIVPYGVVYHARVKRERHLLVWSYSRQVGGIKHIKRVRLYLKWCPGVVEHSFINRILIKHLHRQRKIGFKRCRFECLLFTGENARDFGTIFALYIERWSCTIHTYIHVLFICSLIQSV